MYLKQERSFKRPPPHKLYGGPGIVSREPLINCNFEYQKLFFFCYIIPNILDLKTHFGISCRYLVPQI